MTDNVTANQGAGGPVFRTDEVGGVHTPISKVAFGVDGTVTTVDASNPLPVSVASAVVSGEVSLDAATLTALETVQIGNFPASQTVDGSVSVSNFPATQPISGTVTANTGLSQPLTDTQLRASAVPVSTGGITDAQLRATPVPISGSVTTGGLTDAQLRATAVPVSGTVTANTGLTQPLTDTQLRAADVKVSLDGETVAINNFPDTQKISAVSMPLPAGASTDATAQAIQSLSDQIKIMTDTMLYYMTAVLEKMPRVTGNDQAAIVAEGGTLSTVTTCGTVTTISQIGTRAAMTTADAQIMQGTSHLYNNILVS